MLSKFETYLGFAIKKGSVVYGVDQIVNYRKKMFVIVFTNDLSQNSLKVLTNFATERKLAIVKANTNQTMLQRNCKALAVTDKSLSTAIVNELTVSQLEEING